MDSTIGSARYGRVSSMVMPVLRAIAVVNTILLRIGRNIAWVALALMVIVILLQVFFRYVLNNALAWPDEAARFLMLWMTGLVAPSAFRWGGFVAIDMVPRALPKTASLMSTVFLLILSIIVLSVGLRHGYDHTFGFGGRFDSASLRVPLDLIGLESFKVKLRYMYGSLLSGILLLVFVNVELILRASVSLLWPDEVLPDDDAPAEMLGTD